MHFDALTLACVTEELNRVILTGRVQQVLMPDEHSISLEIYAQRQRHYLLLCLNAQQARVHLASQKLRRGAEQPIPLLLLLRKYVRDSLLVAITQPDPTERLLQLAFAHAQHGPTTLIAEIIGQRSNLVLLTPEGKIMECLQRVRATEPGQRTLLPGQLYTPPPKPARLAPVDDGSPDYYSELEAVTHQPGKLWKVLTASLAGISPTLGREIAWRATGDSESETSAVNFLELVQTLQELWAPVQTGAWQPGVWVEESEGDKERGRQGNKERVTGFAAYEVHGRGHFVPVDSISQAVEQFYSQGPVDDRPSAPRDAYAGLRTTVAGAVRKAQQRVERQLTALAGDEPLPGAAEQLRAQAEWLLALHSQIEPGQSELTVDLGEQTLRIALDQQKMPVEQAEQMFKTAAKWERAARFIPERRATLQADLAFLAQLNADLALAENQPEIAAVREELYKAGFLPTPQRKELRERSNPAASQPRRYYSPQGFAILVGRNARQNDQVTFDLAQGEDLWLHVRNAPGSHVVIRNAGQTVSAETLHLAAQLAAYYSTLRGERAATVSYTPRRHVTRVPGGRPGQVYVRNEQTITVVAELPEIFRG